MKTLNRGVVAVLVAAVIGALMIAWGFWTRPANQIPELVKITYQFLLVTVIGGGVFLLLNESQQRRAAVASESQNIKERDLLVARELYAAYGEFYSTWKLWHFKKKDDTTNVPDQERFELLKSAASAEGRMEAIFIHVASEIVLEPSQQAELGRLRQGFQQLREKIEADKRVPWHSSDHPKYREFKRLNTFLGSSLSTRKRDRCPSPKEASDAIGEISSNKYETYWDS
jgi:hypothetical protein